MADTKVSELTTATSVGGSDILYLVQSNTSKKVTAATLFQNAANVTLKGSLRLDGVQTLTNPGVIDTSKLITQFSAGASGGTMVLPAGAENQIKILVMTATTGGVYTVSGNIANSSSIIFSKAGNTATLLYTATNWFVIGGTAALT